jgi:hypothetical protein
MDLKTETDDLDGKISKIRQFKKKICIENRLQM